MKLPKRQHLRPIDVASIADKRFARVFPVKTRIDLKKSVHPLMVLADLRRGSISSLDRYLLKTKGVIDRKVALELRKLISGSIQRTKFRLIVIGHPDTPKNKGGRPKATTQEPTVKEFAVADDFKMLKATMKVDAAAASTVAEHSVGTSTVYKYGAKVRKFRESEDEANSEKLKRESDRQTLLLRRNAARRALMDSATKESK